MVAVRLRGKDEPLSKMLSEFWHSGGEGIEEAKEDLAVHGRLDALVKELRKDALSRVHGNLEALRRQIEQLGRVTEI